MKSLTKFSQNIKPVPFQELLNEMISLLGVTKEELGDRIAQFYTDLNIDVPLYCSVRPDVGLRSWYPYDQLDEETQPTVKAKRKSEKVVEEDLDLDEFEEVDEDDIDLDEMEEDIDLDADSFDDEDVDEEDDDELEIEDEMIEEDEEDYDDEEEDRKD